MMSLRAKEESEGAPKKLLHDWKAVYPQFIFVLYQDLYLNFVIVFHLQFLVLFQV